VIICNYLPTQGTSGEPEVRIETKTNNCSFDEHLFI